MSNKKQKVILKFKDDSFIEQFNKLILQTGKVKLSGIGIFELKRINERESFNIQTRKIFMLPSHNKIVFKPTKSLKDNIQSYDGTK